jgi:hypothetical protein
MNVFTARFPSTWAVRKGRDEYLAENGFTVESYDDEYTQATFLGVDFGVPNTARHRVGIMLHDLHHVATGFGTDLAGEGEISAWEVRGGLRGLGVYVASIVLTGFAMGLLFAPKRTLRAWKAAKTARPLWEAGVMYDELLAKSVAELREIAGVPADGVAPGGPRALHANAPRPASPTPTLV